MKTLLDWVHNGTKSETLRIVKITDLKITTLGLLDEKTGEVFILGNLHDLTFILEGNEK